MKLVDEYLTYIRCELNLSVSTVLCYEKALREWIDFSTDGDEDRFYPFDVTVSDLRQWVAHIAAKGMAARSLRLKVQAIRAFYKFLARRHGATVNPAAELPLAKLDKPLPVFVRQNEMEELLDEPSSGNSFENERNRLIIAMFYETGIRVSELCTLLDRNVDTCRSELKVLGKRNKERIVPFGSKLNTQIESYRAERQKIPGEKIEEFFVRADGRPLSRQTVYYMINKAMKNVGVSAARLSPHVLRHTFATDMVNNGAELTAVQKLLGHTSLATTQIYTHSSFKELKENYLKAHPREKK